MTNFTQYLQSQQQRPAPPLTHGSALMALMTAALQARQQPPPQAPILMPGPAPDPEYQRGYQMGLELLRRQGR